MVKETEFLEEHLNHLVDIIDEIDINKVTVLTGGNGRGKSVIRKQMTGICQRDKIKTWSCSMDKRAGFDSAYGGMMVFGRDCEWLPTSINTFNSIENFQKAENSYGILDEIEIGMSEESQFGIALYINEHLKEYMEKNHGLLIITHSKHLVRNINADAFFNIEGMSKEEWLNREIIPTDFSKLDSESRELYYVIQDRLKH